MSGKNTSIDTLGRGGGNFESFYYKYITMSITNSKHVIANKIEVICCKHWPVASLLQIEQEVSKILDIIFYKHFPGRQ